MIRSFFEDFLSKKGVHFAMIRETLLSFEYDNKNFLFEYFLDDQQYFRVLLPVIDEYSEEKNTILIKMNNQYKVGKFIVVQENIWITAESFVYSTLDIDKLFERLIGLLTSMITDYRQETINLRRNRE